MEDGSWNLAIGGSCGRRVGTLNSQIMCVWEGELPVIFEEFFAELLTSQDMELRINYVVVKGLAGEGPIVLARHSLAAMAHRDQCNNPRRVTLAC